MTELERALMAAENDPSEADRFYAVFLNSNLFVPTRNVPEETGRPRRASEDEAFSPLVVEGEGGPFLPVFETQERLASWAERETGFVRIPAYALVEAIGRDVRLALNVGTESSKAFSAEEMEWLRDAVARASPSKVRFRAGTQYLYGEPASTPAGLKDALRRCLRENSEVIEAYLGQVFSPDEDERPSLFLVLKMEPGTEGVSEAIFKQIGIAIRGVLPQDEHLDMAVLGREEIAASVAEVVTPFYVK